MKRACIRQDGAEEWLCPSCGRHLLLQFLPRYHKLVLQPGDEYVAHTGTTDGVQIGSVEVVALGDRISSGPGLDWQRWLADNGIDWDGPAA